MTTQDFAEELAYDCVHNNHPKEMIENSAPASYIAPANESSNSSKTPEEIVQDKLQLMATMVEKFTSMMSSNCAPVPKSVNAERCSSESTITDLTSDISAHGQHDPVYCSTKVNVKDDNRPTKRNCVVCNKKTRYVCSHPGCQRRVLCHRKQKFLGTPICSNMVGPRTHLEKYGGANNTLRCIEIHRKEMANLFPKAN